MLDRAAIERLVATCGEGGAEFVAGLLDTFFADLPELLATLRRALDDRDGSEVRRAAHTVKSHGATFGAPFMAHLAHELETMSRQGQLDGAPDLAGELDCEFRRVHRELQMVQADLLGASCPTFLTGGSR